MPDEEVWKPIPSTNGVYAASSLGRIKRVAGGRGTRLGQTRKLQRHPQGYVFVKLSVGNKRRQPLVHELVAEAFIGPRPHAAVINHLDGAKTNNRPENLVYATYGENLEHTYTDLGRAVQQGEHNGNAKLTDAQVIEMRKRAHAGETQGALAEAFGVSQPVVSGVVSGKFWSHLNAVAPPVVRVAPPRPSRAALDAEPMWKLIPGFSLYEASKQGKIRRAEAGRGTQKGHVLAPQDDTHGYWQVRIPGDDGEYHTVKVYVLVALAFFGPNAVGCQVNHLNGNTRDNRLANIEYVTPRENAEHALRELGRHVACGEARSELTDDDIRTIRRRVAAGESRAAVARDYPVGAKQIGHIVARRSWPHVE